MSKAGFLNRRHSWQPYQRLTRSVKRLIGQEAFSHIKVRVRGSQHIPVNTRPQKVLAEGINVIGLLKTESGVGEAARGYVRALDAVGIPSSLHDIPLSDSRMLDRTLEQHKNYHEYDVTLINLNPDVLIGAYKAKRSFIDNHYCIGQWTWELSQFPERWKHAFNLIHELWVPSTFVKKTIESTSPVPVFVIPHVVERSPTGNFDRKHFNLSSDKFLFLTMFDFHSVMERKNPIGTINAFKTACANRHDAQLVIKCINSERYPDEFHTLQSAIGNDAQIVLVNGYQSREETLDLINICDAFVSLHRSEGFGLALAEAMFMKKPVIATHYSGNTDFMDDSNSFPVRHTLKELNQSYGPYERGNVWAEPNVHDAALQMRRVIQDPHERLRRATAAQQTMQRRFSAKVVGETLAQRLADIRSHTA